MTIILLGAPGSGKGTQARVLADRYGTPIISTGEILREAARRETDLGREAKSFTDRGQLVPDRLIVPIVTERLREPDCGNGFLLDGFPRTVAQAEALDRFLDEQGIALDAVLHLVVEQDELVRRLSGRRVCSRCGRSYHLDTRPPQRPGVCDRDGAPLEQRDDDRPETVRQRLEISERETAPVVDYFRRKGVLATIDGSLPLDDVTRAMEAVLVGKGALSPRGESQAGQPAPRR
jgi:adenylate kinase